MNLQGFSLSKVLQKVGSAFSKHGDLIAAGAGLIPGGTDVMNAARLLTQGQNPGPVYGPPPAPPPATVSRNNTMLYVAGGVLLLLMLRGRR